MNIRQGYVFSFEDAINLQPRSRLEIILSTLDFDDVITALAKNNEQHRGPTGYSVEHKIKALIAMRVYNMADDCGEQAQTTQLTFEYPPCAVIRSLLAQFRRSLPKSNIFSVSHIP